MFTFKLPRIFAHLTIWKHLNQKTLQKLSSLKIWQQSTKYSVDATIQGFYWNIIALYIQQNPSNAYIPMTKCFKTKALTRIRQISNLHACRGCRASWALACGFRGASGGPRPRPPPASQRASPPPSPHRSGTPPRRPWLRPARIQLQSTESSATILRRRRRRAYLGRAGRGTISPELQRRTEGGGAREMRTREPWDWFFFGGGGRGEWVARRTARRRRRNAAVSGRTRRGSARLIDWSKPLGL